jgi:hypothetical protein
MGRNNASPRANCLIQISENYGHNETDVCCILGRDVDSTNVLTS